MIKINLEQLRKMCNGNIAQGFEVEKAKIRDIVFYLCEYAQAELFDVIETEDSKGKDMRTNVVRNLWIECTSDFSIEEVNKDKEDRRKGGSKEGAKPSAIQAECRKAEKKFSEDYAPLVSFLLNAEIKRNDWIKTVDKLSTISLRIVNKALRALTEKAEGFTDNANNLKLLVHAVDGLRIYGESFLSIIGSPTIDLLTIKAEEIEDKLGKKVRADKAKKTRESNKRKAEAEAEKKEEIERHVSEHEKEIEKLRSSVRVFEEAITTLKADNKKLKADNEKLSERNAHLEKLSHIGSLEKVVKDTTKDKKKAEKIQNIVQEAEPVAHKKGGSYKGKPSHVNGKAIAKK